MTSGGPSPARASRIPTPAIGIVSVVQVVADVLTVAKLLPSLGLVSARRLLRLLAWRRAWQHARLAGDATRGLAVAPFLVRGARSPEQVRPAAVAPAGAGVSRWPRGSSRSHRAIASASIAIALRARHRALTTSLFRSVGLVSRSLSNDSVAAS